MPPGRSASAPGAQDRALELREPRGLGGRLAPAGVGPRRERAEVRARRVDEHAVVGLGLLRPRGVGRAHLDRGRPHARGRARERLRAPGDGARPPRRRRGPPSAPPGAWSCRPARRTGRARARPGRGASTRPTAIAARDCGMNAPCSHSGEPNASQAPSSTSPSGRPSAGRLATGSSRRELGGRRSAARWRAAPPRPGGCRRPSARARRPARAPRTTARRPSAGASGARAASAAVPSGQRLRRARAPRARRAAAPR